VRLKINLFKIPWKEGTLKAVTPLVTVNPLMVCSSVLQKIYSLSPNFLVPDSENVSSGAVFSDVSGNATSFSHGNNNLRVDFITDLDGSSSNSFFMSGVCDLFLHFSVSLTIVVDSFSFNANLF